MEMHFELYYSISHSIKLPILAHMHILLVPEGPHKLSKLTGTQPSNLIPAPLKLHTIVDTVMVYSTVSCLLIF